MEHPLQGRIYTHFPWTLFVNSAAIRGSISIAVTCFAFSNIRTVRFPVPGPDETSFNDNRKKMENQYWPTSSTLSVGRKFALSTILYPTSVYSDLLRYEESSRLCNCRVFEYMLTESFGVEYWIPSSGRRSSLGWWCFGCTRDWFCRWLVGPWETIRGCSRHRSRRRKNERNLSLPLIGRFIVIVFGDLNSIQAGQEARIVVT